MNSKKWCWDCQQYKPIFEFSKDNTRPDGLRNRCKTCTKKYGSIYRSKNREKERNRNERNRVKNIVTNTQIENELLNRLSDEDLITQIQKRGYFTTKDAQIQDYHFKPNIIPFKGDTYRIAIVGDTQIGSRYQQLTHLHTFYKMCQKREVRDVFHCGDLTDGQNIYNGHEFELFLQGVDAQKEYTIENYPEYKDITTYFICGNHDESHYKHAGVDIGKAISERRKDLQYKGFHGAYFTIGGIDKLIYLHHGTGGVAYARSYKLQKQIEQFAPDMKPFMFFEGHYHVSCHLPMYRNVIAWSVPCFQSQTPYLKAKGLYPEIGGIIMEFTINNRKPILSKFEYVPFYVPVEEDFK